MEKVRINKYDNLKGLAILLVVFGHLDFMDTIGHIYSLFFLIDLPIFFFVAGYFSKIDIDQPAKVFKRLMVPYFIFCFLITLFHWLYMGTAKWDMIFLQSSMAMWFLISLFIMKMLLPIFDKFKFPIITALLFALLFGLYDIHPNILGLTRTFPYMTIFLLGYYYKDYKQYVIKAHQSLYNFYDRHFKLVLIPVILATAVVYIKIESRFFIFKSPYTGNLLYEAIKRLIVLLLIMALVLILHRVMTNRECVLTQLGRNSMAIYVIHPFIYYFFKPIWPEVFANNIIGAFIATCILVAITVFILSRDPVTIYLNKFTDGVYDLITRPV